MLTLEIGGNLLTALALVVGAALVDRWWRYRAGARR